MYANLSMGGEKMQYTVKQARVLMDFTQEQMAEKMGISRWTYRKIEENPESATIKQAKQIAKITQIPIDNIFFANKST